MLVRFGGKRYFDEYTIRREFGITPETLALWRGTGALLTIIRDGKTLYECQSLRACIARRQGDRNKQ